MKKTLYQNDWVKGYQILCVFIKLMGYGNFCVRVLIYGGQRITQQLKIPL